MKLKVISIDDKKVSDIDILDEIFSLKPDNYLIQSLIDWQLNHFKPRTAKTKQRNEIRGSTKKIYAQKGTGGARHSSRKAPIFVGGGVAHGQKGKVYKIKKINKKIKKIGLFHLLSQKNKINSLFIIEDFKNEIKKTKILNNFLEKHKLNYYQKQNLLYESLFLRMLRLLHVCLIILMKLKLSKKLAHIL